MEPATHVALLEEIETQGQLLQHLVDKLEARARTQGDVDGRSVATARTQLQGGFKWLRDALKRPGRF